MVFDVSLQFLVSTIFIIVGADREILRISRKILLMIGVCAGTMSDSTAAERMKLVSTTDANQGARVRIVLDVKGDLKLNADGRQVTRVPLTAHGLLTYDQRVLRVGPEVRRDVRHYREASAQINVGGSSETSSLSSNRRIVVVDCNSQRTTIYSPLGPLAREQLELIEIQGNPMLLDRLLPTSEVDIGDHWRHDDQLVAQLFGLDAIHRNDLTSTLRAVSDVAGRACGTTGCAVTVLCCARIPGVTRRVWYATRRFGAVAIGLAFLVTVGRATDKAGLPGRGAAWVA